MTRVLVTGGAGFIGANLAKTLAAAGAQVVVLDDLSTGFASNLDGADVEFVHGSVLDGALVSRLMEDAATVIHLGALPSVPRSIADPMASHEVNATGTVTVLDAARRASTRSHVIMASSSSVYGANPTLPKHEALTPEPMSPYAVSKLAAERYALAYQACYDLPVLAFRFFNVFGPLQQPGHGYAAVVPSFVDAALSGLPLPVHGDGGQSRDFTFVDSLVDVLMDAARRKVTSPTPVNLAFGTRHTLLELVEQLEIIVGRTLDVEHLDPRPGDVRHSQADQTRLRELFPDVSAVGFDVGLKRTVEWMASRP